MVVIVKTKLLGFVKLPLFVQLIVAGLPALLVGVNVNVAEGDPVDKVTVVGLNVPLVVEAGVIVVEDAVPPEGVNVTVKLEEVEPIVS